MHREFAGNLVQRDTTYFLIASLGARTSAARIFLYSCVSRYIRYFPVNVVRINKIGRNENLLSSVSFSKNFIGSYCPTRGRKALDIAANRKVKYTKLHQVTELHRGTHNASFRTGMRRQNLTKASLFSCSNTSTTDVLSSCA